MDKVAKQPSSAAGSVAFKARSIGPQRRTAERPQRSFATLPDPLLRRNVGPQRKARCSSCQAKESLGFSGPESCPTCDHLVSGAHGVKLESPPSGTQHRRTNPEADAAERQADDIGASVGSALAGVSYVGAGPLSAPAREAAERVLGTSLEGAELRNDARAHEHAAHLDALAVTEGSTVSFARSEFSPATSEGRNLIGHELVHVAQQRSASRSAAQRQAAGMTSGQAPMSVPAPNVSTAPAIGNSVDYGGETLTADSAALRAILGRIILNKKGLKGAEEFVSGFEAEYRPFSAPVSSRVGGASGAGGAGGASGGGGHEGASGTMTPHPDQHAVASTVAPLLREELSAFTKQRATFLPLFDQQARTLITAMLDDSEKRLKTELVRYGVDVQHLSEQQRPEQGGAEGASGRSIDVYSMKETIGSTGMLAAAKDLHEAAERLRTAQSRFTALEADLAQMRRGMGRPVAEIAAGGATGMSLAQQEDFEKRRSELQEAQKRHALLLSTYGAKYPILAGLGDPKRSGELQKLAQQDQPNAIGAEVVSRQLTGHLDDIALVRFKLGEVQLHKVPQVAAAAVRALGESPQTINGVFAMEKLRQDASDAQVREITLLILQLLLTGLSLFAGPLGLVGRGVAAAAGVAGTAIDVATLIKDVQDFQLDSALANTDPDRARAISQDDPSMFWLAVSIAFTGIGLSDAKRSFDTARALVHEVLDASDDATRVAARAKLAEGLAGKEYADEVLSTVDRLTKAGGRATDEAILGSTREVRAVAEATGVLAGAELASKTIGNFTAKVTPSGALVTCSVCGWLRDKFAAVLADPRAGTLADRLLQAENVAIQAKQAARAGDDKLAKQLADQAAMEGARLANELDELRRLVEPPITLDKSNLKHVIDELSTREGLTASDEALLENAVKSGKGIDSLPPFLRGRVAHILMGENLPPYFKTIDVMVRKGKVIVQVTSIKTHDPRHFQESGKLMAQLMDEVDKLAAFRTFMNASGDVERLPSNVQKVLDVGMPADTFTSSRWPPDLVEQWRAEIGAARVYAQQRGIAILLPPGYK